jgi:ABC-type multidrug transport system ATPase subunit
MLPSPRLGASNQEAVAQLMAYAAEADGRVSPEELESLQQFLSERYSGTARGTFFALFRDAVDHRPDIERIVSTIRDGLPAYADRLRVYAAVQALLTTSGMTAEESNGLARVAALLDVTPADADLLANAARAVPDLRFPLNRERVIRVDARGAAVVAMEIADLVAVASPDATILEDGVAHPPGDIIFMEPAQRIRAGSAEIGFNDFSRLFDLAKRQAARTIGLDVEGNRLVPRRDGGAAFELRVAGAALSLLVRDGRERVEINGAAAGVSTPLLPSDVLGLEAGAIRVAQILDALDATLWPLAAAAPAAFRYAIADAARDGTEHVLADLDGELSIVIEESGAAAPLIVAIDRCACSATVRLDDRVLAAGARMPLSAPATLKIGHHAFAIDPGHGTVAYSRRVVERFAADGVSYHFHHALALKDITFSASAGELVGIMGASGAGKSTLLSVLLGLVAPDAGTVRLNGDDLHAQLRRCRSILGYVPQDDLVMDTLTVEENLLYSGRIRLPQLSAAELSARVTRVLHDIGLFESRGLRVGNPVSKVLSGGQRKRLNIGLELLADPELFFLDEPTSGLSSQDSQAIVTLLGRLARRGKLVFVVIHQPSSDIFKMFDQLLILDTGGVLVWYGPARDAIAHFKAFLPDHREFVECPACGSVNPETVLRAIEQPAPASSDSGAARRFDPGFWENAYLLARGGHPPSQTADVAAPLPATPPPGFGSRARALAASIQRAFVDRSRDRTNIVMSVAAPLVLAAAMAGMLRGPDEPYRYAGNTALAKFFFLTTIVFVFFGLMASVNEVIRELALIRRERIAGFKPAQYVAAKTVAFLPFSVVQVGIYTLLASAILHFPGRAPSYSPLQPLVPFSWYFALVAFLILQASFALGLLLSACLRSEAAAFNWIPLVIIPQILLGGVFVNFAELPKFANRVVPEYAELTFSRWGYEALLAGEKGLNPSDAFNADTILAMKQAIDARGGVFNLHDLVEVPRDRWRSEPALPLPPARLSANVLYNTLIRKLRITDRTEDATFLERSYDARDRRTYVLRQNLPPGTTERLAGTLMSPDVGWWGSTFATAGVNESLDAIRQAAAAPDPEPASGWRTVVVDHSDFPVTTRRVGSAVVPVAIWNLLVLTAMAALCHAASALRLKYQR